MNKLSKEKEYDFSYDIKQIKANIHNMQQQAKAKEKEYDFSIYDIEKIKQQIAVSAVNSK